MTLQKGDFILINYTAKVKETNEVFDTTKEEVAKKEHLHKEGEINEPKLVVIGEGWVLKALDDSLKRMEVEQSRNRRNFARQSLRTKRPRKNQTRTNQAIIRKRNQPSHWSTHRISRQNGNNPLHRRRQSTTRLQPSISRQNPNLRRHRDQETRHTRRKNRRNHPPQNSSS